MGRAQKLRSLTTYNEGLSMNQIIFIRSRTTQLLSLLVLTQFLVSCETASQIDSVLYEQIDRVSKEDTVTGVRSLNLKSDEAAYARGLATFNMLVAEVQKQSGAILAEDDPVYIRVKGIYDRVISASHYRDAKDLKFAIIDDPMFNAYALGGGHVVVYKGIVDGTNDDELANVIGHELAHNSAAHISESQSFMKMRSALKKENREGYETVHSNVNEQEADRIGIIYSTLAGFDPKGSVSVWQKKSTNDPNRFSYFRSHPENGERAYLNNQTVLTAAKYYMPNQLNPEYESLLVCNDVFCKSSGIEAEAGKGGGILRTIEVIADTVIKNTETKQELRRQQAQIDMNPPNIQWPAGYAVYRGQVARHGNPTGMTFGLSNTGGVFYYNFDGQTFEGQLSFTGKNQHGNWYRWADQYGRGNLVVQQYTDGSVRGKLYMDDGKTQSGQLLGDWYGIR